MGSRDGLPRLLRHFGASTLSFSSARRRNLFRFSLRLNGTSDIGIASWKLVAGKATPRKSQPAQPSSLDAEDYNFAHFEN